MTHEKLRNIAVIAHVDHGKTTLVDAILKQTQTVKDDGSQLIMDSGDLERERGITIKAKNASISYKGVKINIIDTPGHADFGGEVERTLRMADGVLLLVDAKEGPMPQTRFVLKKALELGLGAIVVVNKVDKPDADEERAINKTFDLFVQLGANDKQLDFPIIYASGISGIAGLDSQQVKDQVKSGDTSEGIKPLLDTILKEVPAPEVELDSPFAMLVLSLAYDNYKGKIAIGKIQSGKIKKAQQLAQVLKDGKAVNFRATAIQVYEGLKMVETEEAEAGDVVAISGCDSVQIGETFSDAANVIQIEPIHVEPPTVKMTFGVNTSPFAGQEGKLVTSRQIRERLFKELETNVALNVEESQTTDKFLVSGRGELHLGILIETMRREGFELEISQPQVIYHEKDGVKQEPFEFVTVDVPEEHQGVIIEEMGKRGGVMQAMETAENGESHFEFICPTRGLIGVKNLLLTRTRGTAVLNNLFDSYRPAAQVDEHTQDHGSLIASEAGQANSYGLNNAQERGVLFIGPGTQVYEGMIVGQHALDSDLEVNVCKAKKLSNMRTSSSDEAIILTPPKTLTLDYAMEYIGSDELVEITPQSLRIRKKYLSSIDRKRAKRD